MASRVISTKTRGAHKIRLTRTERADLIERRLFQAAVKVVGSDGYAGATVSRITALAGVAQGTFYNYFPTRQHLLDRLLPVVGQDLLEFIRGEVTQAPTVSPLKREMLRFQAFFDFLLEVPEFLRILVEAEVYAPVGYQHHMDTVAADYVKALKRDHVGSDVLSDAELDVIAHILMGARSYLCQKFSYTDGVVHPPPASVLESYRKLLEANLFNRKGKPSKALG